MGLPKTKPAKPEQLKLAGFSSEQEDEIEVVLERFDRIKQAAKLQFDREKVKYEVEIADAEAEVFEILEKYDLKFLKVRGWTAAYTERRKLTVKGSPREKRAKP